MQAVLEEASTRDRTPDSCSMARLDLEKSKFVFVVKIGIETCALEPTGMMFPYGNYQPQNANMYIMYCM
jgi:hypothetical protein